MVSGVQGVAFVSGGAEEAGVGPGGVKGGMGPGGLGSVVSPPPAKLVLGVRGCFVGGLYKGLSGMVENAEKGLGGEKGEVGGGFVVVGEGEVGDGRVDASNK
ncbi:Exocyst complex component S5, partial [Teratosphaeriaceae sp. CCFEE 6253]